MPKRNYGFEKRQKELSKQRQKEEKKQRKLDQANTPPDDELAPLVDAGEPTPQA